MFTRFLAVVVAVFFVALLLWYFAGEAIHSPNLITLETQTQEKHTATHLTVVTHRKEAVGSV